MRSVHASLLVPGAVLFLLVPAGLLCAETNDEPVKIAVGDMQFAYHPYRGAQLSLFGIPMLKGSTIYFMKPAWAGKYYGQQDNPYLLDRAVVEPFEGGKRIILTHVLPDEFDSPVKGKEIYTLLPDNTLSVTQEFIFLKNEPAIVEWKVAGVNPAPFIGCAYTAETMAKTIEGIIPVEAKAAGIEESMFAKGFARLTIDSRIGPVTIEADPDDVISFFDYRKNVWAAADNPILWLGALEREITPNTPYSYTVTFRFPPKMDIVSRTAPERTARVDAVSIDDALAPNWGQDFIIPKPKSLAFDEGRFALSSNTRLYVGDNPGEGIEHALDFFLTELRNVYDLEPRVVRKSVAPQDVRGGAIFLGEAGRYAAPLDACTEAGLTLPQHDEGYVLNANADAVVLAANTERGVFYGLTSLLQLIRVTDEGVSIRAASIADYPSLDFRGVHCLSGKGAGDEIAKALRTLLARFKLNSLVWECEYIIWKGHEDIAHPQFGMTMEDAETVVDAAKRNFIEIIPLVQSLGHSEWIFTNDRNLDIAEDPETPYAYNPTNPRTYDFIFDVYQQAIDLFHPRYFHIGHDEITSQGRFPWRSRESGKSLTDLMLMDIDKLHGWFKERDIRVMMWGDMFLYRDEAPDARAAPTLEEARIRRSLLPKDIVITDWHYAAAKPEEYASIKIWKDAGFDAIGAGWDNPTNIGNLAQACVLGNAEGYLQTTWAGFNFQIDNNEQAWHQYWAYILAAHYSWSGDTTPAQYLLFSAKEKFLDAWFGRKPLLHKRSGHILDLRPVVNRRLADSAQGDGWLGYGPEFDFSSLPAGLLRAGETLFHIRENDDREAAVLLAGRFNPSGEFPEEVVVEFEPISAAELHFLMNTAYRTIEKSVVGSLGILYTDGTTASHELVYGKNIFSFYDARIGEDTRVAWEGTSNGGRSIRAWDVRWENPHPGKRIRGVTVRSGATEASPVLFAVTVVSPEKSRKKFLGIF